MGGLSLWHWIIVLLVVLILFGRGRISEIMGDFGKGIKSFKEGINDESGERSSKPSTPPAQIPAQPPETPASPAPSSTTDETKTKV
ncbi:twin-arginine translocase TatA/TatE family subunit [Novosphingobium sp. M1R2S20]|uniref:Sec-independent protein translocase protein TatA n=1 Tax=Novosphingobium rhizovicinum TaxID=3228928 RepID=A0ABV3R8K3_9SPHN